MIAGSTDNSTAINATFVPTLHLNASEAEIVYNILGSEIYSEPMDLSTQIQFVQDKMKGAHDLGYGLGVALGNLIRTRTDDFDEPYTPAFPEQPDTPIDSMFIRFINYVKPKVMTVINLPVKLTQSIIASYYNYSPLHLALFNNDLQAFQEAISNSVDIHSQDIYGRTPAYYAIENGNYDALKMLLEAGLSLQDMLESAILKKDPDLLKNLLGTGIDFNFERLLRYVLDTKDPEMFDILLRTTDNDINTFTFEDQPLLEHLLLENQFEMVDILKANGAQDSKKNIVLFITNSFRNGFMYQRALADINNRDDCLGVTISISKSDMGSSSRELEIFKEFRHIKMQLSPNENFPQAILNSGIYEVEKIKYYAKLAFKYCDGIWLSGGDNIWEDWYRNTEYEPMDIWLDLIDIWRDILEIAILDLQQKHIYKPLIGVCRGNQMINVFYGGTLTGKGERGLNSLVINSNEGILGSVKLDDPRGWSMHEQSIDRLATKLVVVMSSPEGMVKAVQSASNALPLMGTQFHPEMTHHSDTKTGQSILNQFHAAVSAAKKQSCLAVDLVLITREKIVAYPVVALKG